MDYAGRRSRALRAMEEQGLDALLVTRMTNIRYLTGFSGTTAMLVLGPEPAMIADFRYLAQVEREVADLPIRMVQSVMELWPEVERTLLIPGHRRIGFESAFLPTQRYLALTSREGPEWVPTVGLVEGLRMRKDEQEVSALREAMRITDGAMDDIVPEIRPGVTELHLSGVIELSQRDRGGEHSASDIIVASGPRTALPHGMPTDRVLAPDEPVMFDLGTVVGGYLGDLTRTVHIGPAPADLREIYAIVLEAQQLALTALAPGKSGRAIDAIARDHIAAAGYGDRFGHSLGHGIGLDNHESVMLSPYSEIVLEPGMVTTVEPGIYLPGRGGVRIEDTVVITENGHENITSSPKELVEL
jgi:Xaa-Pro aminopeptidase